MLMKICSRIMSMRKKYGLRRARAIKELSAWSSMLARRERQRRVKLTSRKRVKMILDGRLRRGDRRDIRDLDKVVRANRGDFELTLRCLKEATGYVDDVVMSPKLIRDAKYMWWSQTLDKFLTEMRSLVEMNRRPAISDTEIIETLITRLSMMRIYETLGEQTEVRLSLEDTVESLFSLKWSQRRKLRMTGC